jgi:hypothetical protein
MTVASGKFALKRVRCVPAGDDWALSLYFKATTGRPRSGIVGIRTCPRIEPASVHIYRDSDRVRVLTAKSVSYRKEKLGVVQVTATAEKGVAHDAGAQFLLELRGVAGLDPRFASLRFSFEPVTDTGAEAGSDAQTTGSQADPDDGEIRIDYQAKDYASFLKQMQDCATLELPQWRERHAADVGVTITELLAYAADYLSYYQDAVATEAYLTTARRRVSLRRHSRMLDYTVNDGWNARVWVQICVDADDNGVTLARGERLLANGSAQQQSRGTAALTQLLQPGGTMVVVDPDIYSQMAQKQQLGVFATMHQKILYREFNSMPIYREGSSEWILPKGGTEAILQGDFHRLAAGDVLIFSEESESGDGRGWAVRLLRAPLMTNSDAGMALTRIAWGPDDALPWDVILSDGTGERPSWTVLGNIVLADYGRAVRPEALPPVPVVPGSYYPRLQCRNLIFAEPYNDDDARTRPASQTLIQQADLVLPQVVLTPDASSGDPFSGNATLPVGSWTARQQLLLSGRFAQDFVPETEEDGSIRLRFGDDVHGASPAAGQTLTAHYRVSDIPYVTAYPGVIGQIVGTDFRITKVWNPMAAQPGGEPVPLEQIRTIAPNSYRIQKRCVVESDYADAAKEHPLVRDAVCQWRWTGSWQTAFVYVDLLGGGVLSDQIRGELDAIIEPRRMAGCDVEFRNARTVSLAVSLQVYVQPGFFRNMVYQALRATFVGVGAFFDPDRFTFGQPVYLSQIVAAACGVAGVGRVDPLQFQRWGEPARGELASGVLPMGPLEVARVAGIPDEPEQGSIVFKMESEGRS